MPVTIAVIKKIRNRDKMGIGNDVEKRKHLYTVGGNVNWYSHY